MVSTRSELILVPAAVKKRFPKTIQCFQANYLNSAVLIAESHVSSKQVRGKFDGEVEDEWLFYFE